MTTLPLEASKNFRHVLMRSQRSSLTPHKRGSEGGKAHILLRRHDRPPSRGLKELPPCPYAITTFIPQDITNFPILKLAKGGGKSEEIKGTPHLLTIQLIFERAGGNSDGAQLPGADEVEDLVVGKGGREEGRSGDCQRLCVRRCETQF
jgi:hypothetical protein